MTGDQQLPDETASNEQPQRSNAAPDAPSGPRTGSIIWGTLVLAFCGYMAIQLIAPDSIDATAFTISIVIGLGLLLLAVGAAVMVRSRGRRSGDPRP